MDVRNFLSEARDAMTVKRVYGEPLQHDGLTVIPAAKLAGGGGGGAGHAPGGEGEGEGGGFGMGAKPVGAYVIEGGHVRWKPAVDLTQVLLLGFLSLLAIRSIVKIRAKSKLRMLEAKA